MENTQMFHDFLSEFNNKKMPLVGDVMNIISCQ